MRHQPDFAIPRHAQSIADGNPVSLGENLAELFRILNEFRSHHQQPELPGEEDPESHNSEPVLTEDDGHSGHYHEHSWSGDEDLASHYWSDLDPDWDDLDVASAKVDKSLWNGNGKAVGKNKTSDEGDASGDGSTGGTTAETSEDTTSTGTTSTDTTSTDTSSDTTSTDGTTAETNTGSDDPNTYVSGLDTPDGYNIEIVFNGDWDDGVRQAVCDIAETLSDVIVGDLPDFFTIDDIQIQAFLSEDCPLGQGGVYQTRADSQLAAQSFILLNPGMAVQALEEGWLSELVTHELLHALGFGTTFDEMNLVEDFNGDLRFVGTTATELYNSSYDVSGDLLASQGVPIESDGGFGTRGAHWDEGILDNELMTGTLDIGESITDLTLAALEDMGYQTIYGEPEEEEEVFIV